MKKTIMVLMAVALCRIAHTQSQPEPAPILTDTVLDKQLPNGNVTWGLKAGWNYSNLCGKEIDYVFASDQTAYLSGFHAGIFVDTRMSGHFGLKHELLFSQKRIGIPLTDTIYGDYRSKLTMSYLDLMPASFTFYAGGFQLYAGPYVSALLNANVQRRDENGKIYKDNSIFGNPENDETETRYLQKFDFGANLGLAYRFGFGLSVGARYTHGFTDIFQYANSYANGDTRTDNIKIYNRGWMISVGSTLGNAKRLGKK